jgi:hypothetical protein
MLEAFSPGELQAGAFIDKPAKLRDGTITTRSQRNRGTRIPASTWSRMQAGLISPGPRTLAKLASFKQRTQYNTLRASGMPTADAKKFSRSDMATAYNMAAQYRRAAKDVARVLSKTQKRKIKMEWILYYMMKGERDVEDWDKYVTALVGP